MLNYPRWQAPPRPNPAEYGFTDQASADFEWGHQLADSIDNYNREAPSPSFTGIDAEHYAVNLAVDLYTGARQAAEAFTRAVKAFAAPLTPRAAEAMADSMAKLARVTATAEAVAAGVANFNRAQLDALSQGYMAHYHALLGTLETAAGVKAGTLADALKGTARTFGEAANEAAQGAFPWGWIAAGVGFVAVIIAVSRKG